MTRPKDRLQRLDDLVAKLRGPGGCPWDREQTLPDVRAYLLEEAHETAAALDAEEMGELAGELGDLLFQLVFVARLAAEAGEFTLSEVVDRVEAKMVSRHPHVFGDERLDDSGAVRRAWERRKLADRDGDGSLLSGVPRSLPALLRAYRISQKAAGVGFDWSDAASVLAKLEEEIAELRAAAGATGGEAAGKVERVREEVGDLLFAAANLARHLGIDPEGALSKANDKFERRFAAVERSFAERGRSLAAADLDELEAVWGEVKKRETSGD